MKPVAYRQWSTKFHCWDYADDRGDLRKDTEVDALVLQSDAQMLLEALQRLLSRTVCDPMRKAGGSDKRTVNTTADDVVFARTAIARATGQQPDPTR